MPAIVGNVKINSVSQSSIVHFGDSVFLSPASSSKIYTGAGSFAAGDFPVANIGFGPTFTNDSDVLDTNASKGGPA